MIVGTDADRQALRLARAALLREIEAGSDLLASVPIDVVVNALALILATLRARAPEILYAGEIHKITTAVHGLQQALHEALPMVALPVSTLRN